MRSISYAALSLLLFNKCTPGNSKGYAPEERRKDRRSQANNFIREKSNSRETIWLLQILLLQILMFFA